ncbi:hypothetical protein EV207_10882 [Scopulibacillus darangshiensis]|uniref:Uncharacterized protein n=1 Tax=Scopulibacillus darangshiensis TaxID=442528 RepID=A0A4R2P4P7_9BACL|nr:hypothetical protein [Scopulibacillus darangshiensis]TCP29790.1 hypothetical protein EV207_10882 [Scopulibacillus darangshiensis]
MATRSEHVETRDDSQTITWRNWVSWAGIVISLIGFFFMAPVWLGIIGAILGVIGTWGAKNAWGWTSIIVGVVVLILGSMGYTIST